MKTAYKTTAQASAATAQTATSAVIDEETLKIIMSRRHEKPIPSKVFYAQLSKKLGINI